jgi:hypothetical protein
MNIRFIQVTDLTNHYLEQAFAIYRKSFPVNERQKEDLIRQRLNSGREELFAGLKKDEMISMSLVFKLSNPEFVLLDYVAVSENERGTGTGTLFMQWLIENCYQSNKQMILEVEYPGEGKNIEERHRRVNFYRKLGAKCLHGVNYILPALDGITSTKMILMIFEQKNISALPKPEVETLILDLYKQVYNMNADEPLVQNVIRELPKIIELQ